MQRQAVPRGGAFAFASVLFVALVLHIQGAVAQTIPSTATYSCDFENGYCDFHEQSKLASSGGRRSSLVTTPRSGTRGVRLHTEPGDSSVNGSGTWERNDLQKGPDASYCNEGQEEWWAFSILFPSDYVFPPGPEAGIIMDFHHTGSTGQANYEIQTIPGIGLRARGYGGTNVNEGKFDALIPDPYGAVKDVTRNVWYDFVLRIRWSSTGSGFVEGWLNGRKFQSYTGATLYKGMSCYLKLANYHGPYGQASSIIFDRIVRGATAADVAIGELESVVATAPSVPSTPTTPATPTNYTLSAAVSGSGSISSAPAGLACASSCSASFASGSVVTLTASPASGATFAGWSGACSGTGMCSLSMGGNKSVTASFTGQPAPSAPSGATGSAPVSGGIDASAYTVTAGQSVSLVAKVNGSSGTPTGTIAFRANGNAIAGCSAVALSGGSATCSTALSEGSHAITCSYSGNATYGVGSLGPVTIKVQPGVSTGTAPATPAPATPASGAPNVQGLWWQPSESGWGVELSQQGDILFATWFTYDAAGQGTWFVMSEGRRVSDNAYSGKLYRTTGPAFNAATFNASAVRHAEVGSAYFSFSDGSTGTFSATVSGATVTKAITRYVYAQPVPSCTYGNLGSGNYQGLWWRSGGTESGWGLNVTHQGDILFATLFTHDEGGNPLWLEASSLTRDAFGIYSGTIARATGPAFNAQAFDGKRVSRTSVGTMSIAFSADGVNGTLTYTVNGVSITKPITRFVYATPTTICY